MVTLNLDLTPRGRHLSGIYDKIKEDFPDVGISWFYDEPGMEFAGYLPN